MRNGKGGRLLSQLPRGCRVFRAIHPQTQWDWNEILQNQTNYYLEMLLWQNSFNPKKKEEHKAQKPKPFIPDFMKKPEKPSPINDGSMALDTEEIQRMLSLPRG